MTGPSRADKGKGKMPVTRGRAVQHYERRPRRTSLTIGRLPDSPRRVASADPPPSGPYYDAGLQDSGMQFMPTPGLHDDDETQPASQPYDEEDEGLEDIDGDDDAAEETASDGRTVITPVGRGLVPAKAVAAAINNAIRKQFRTPVHSWSSATPELRAYWWDRFREKVTWDPAHHDRIYTIFVQRCTKRLADMLTKARVKGRRPDWIGEEAWEGLLKYWESPEFLRMSERNRTNRASTRGGAVHTSGSRSHVDVAVQMENQLGRSVDPGDLFLATHKRRSGEWVDNRSQHTYDAYQNRVQEAMSQAGSTAESQPPDVSQRIQMWADVSGGVRRGRCYGTADLSANVRHQATALTQQSTSFPSVRSAPTDQGLLLEAREQAARALEESASTKQELATLREQYQFLLARVNEILPGSSSAATPTPAAPTPAPTPAPPPQTGHPDYAGEYDEAFSMLHDTDPLLRSPPH